VLCPATAAGFFARNYRWHLMEQDPNCRNRVLLVSGWLGGMLSYCYGVRVADEAIQSESFR
jgi:hypothetical protein